MKCATTFLAFGILPCGGPTLPVRAAERETIEFSAPDDLAITADVYLAHMQPTAPFIVLFHQAGWSSWK